LEHKPYVAACATPPQGASAGDRKLLITQGHGVLATHTRSARMNSTMTTGL
jgi:hypothetical protein